VVCCSPAARPTWDFVDYAWMGKVRTLRFNVYYFSITDIKGCKHRYIEETLEEDRTRFKAVPTVNPYLTDFATEATGGVGGDDDGTTQGVGPIGSMQAILGAL